MHGVYIEELRPGEVKVSGQENHHLRVKRILPGEKVFLTDGKGNFCIGEVGKIGKEVSVLNCPEVKRARREREIALFLSAFEQGRMELAVEKTTELSAAHIFVFPSERSQRRKIRMDRLRAKAIQAIKQSNNPFLPEISYLSDFSSALKEAENWKGIFFLHKGGQKIRDFPPRSAFFVGPEGGWSGEEIHLFQKRGIKPIGLGETVLRAETAAIAITSLFMLI